ncbi:NRDE protein-domain-containing protein [Bisporella sp. PMI_857]|nr:NRDE protein-domain-containing protein [Bisporella sp. PMI_857]
MCIVLATTAHPSYALIVLDNRDEFILRPTSRPHWWSSHHQQILSARDLQRAEQGTWLGITRTGKFAVLTNYRETDTNDVEHPIQGTRSRGAMVTAWLTSHNDESTQAFIHGLLGGEGVKGVGGFSLVCGKLRRRRDLKSGLEPMAIISNRAGSAEDVPWIAEQRGEVYGLSNTCYDDPITWPKVEMGKEKLLEAVQESLEGDMGEEELVGKLYGILDTDTLPEQEDQDFEAYIFHLRKSIFIPSIGQPSPPEETLTPDQIAASKPISNSTVTASGKGKAELKEGERPDPATSNGMTGIYGTQRQTIILVDWEGHVTFRERSLWDENGNSIERGKGDMKFEFQIEGWNGESRD